LPEALRTAPVHEAMEALEMFTQNDTERARYQARLKAQRDYTSFLREAREEGEAKGMEKGEVLGKIHFCQQLLKQPLTPREQLAALSFSDLEALSEQLKRQLETSEPQ